MTVPGGTKGFTVIELLAVLAIIAVVAAIAAPRFSMLLDYIQLRTDATELSRQLRLVRHQAMSTQVSAQVRFYPFRHFYRTYQPVVTDHELGDRVEFLYVSFPPDTRGWLLCRFSPLGIPAAGGTVALQNRKGQKLYVIVSPVTGRVRVSSSPPAS